MKKVTKLVLMLFLIHSGAFCHASGVAEQENEKGNDGTPISIIEKASHSSSEKGNSILATLNSHMLMVVFTENLGEVVVEVSTATGGYVQTDSCHTPNGLQFYIPLAGGNIHKRAN